MIDGNLMRKRRDQLLAEKTSHPAKLDQPPTATDTWAAFAGADANAVFKGRTKI